MARTATAAKVVNTSKDADDFECGTASDGTEWRVARYGAMVSVIADGEADDVEYTDEAEAREEFRDAVNAWLAQ
jgi:hypothetical protein